MTKIQFTTPEVFIKKVIEDSQLGEMPGEERAKLERSIARRMEERVTTTIIDSFGEEEFGVFNEILDDHPELDEIDALSLVAAKIPGLQERLNEAMQKLYDELLEGADQVKSFLAS